MSKKLGRILKVITIILVLLFVLQIIVNVSKAAEVVELSLVPSPYIDIVLAKGRTDVNLSNFKKDMETALKNRGIDIDKVNITSIESQDVNLQTAFQWKEDVSSSVGSIEITNNGKDVYMKGNPTNQGKNAIWIIPDEKAEQKFTFDYDIDFGDNYNAAGMLLKVKEYSDRLEGYALSFNKSDRDWAGTSGGASGALWEITYTLNENYSNIQKTLVRSLDIDSSGTMTVEVTDEDIIISGAGLSDKVTYEIEKEYGLGFGFFSDHYSHGCNDIGHFELENINLTNTIVKKMEEVLREPEFREESIKALVNVQDNTNKQLTNSSSLGELLTRTINDEIHFMGWGTDQNINEFKNFIAANNNNGLFTYNTNYTNAINDTADYIKSLIDAYKSSQYVILNEPTEIMANQSGIMTGTADSEYPYGKWKIIHDCEYYENNIGQFADSNQYMPDMITEFNKTGKYQIFFADQAVIPTEIYVHRRPVAEIDVYRSGDTVGLTSLGYDLDNYSNNKGIAEEEWKYRKVGSTTWTMGKLTDISDGTDYLVQLRVKDFQNTWSYPISKYITKSSVQPIASFKIKNVNTSIYEDIEIVDGSYDPSGGTITKRTWTVTKDGRQIYSGSTPLTNYEGYGTGEYVMGLTVTSSSGKVSEKFTRHFTIIPDDEAPEFVADPVNCDWKTSQTVNIEFSDRLGSGFKSYKYAITDSQEIPTSWSSPISKQNDSITINQEGIKYLHIIATDNAGNTSKDRVLGPYNIDRSAPTGSIDYNPKSWVIDTIELDWKFSDSKSGLAKVVLPDGQEITNSSTGKYTVTENGTYNFTVTDNLGNSQIISKEITNIDKVDPIIALSQKPTEWTDSNTIITWECTDTQSGFREVLLPDGTLSKNSKGEYIASRVGTYTFIGYDNVGNEKTVSIQVQNVDKTSPSLELNTNFTDWVNEDIMIDWNSSDLQSGFRDILLPDGSLTKSNKGTYVAKQNGVYTFVSYDNVGNTTMKNIEIKNIDKIAPEITLELGKGTNGETIIRWSMSDAESGEKEMLMPNGKFSNNVSGEYEVTAEGSYTFVAYDIAGNMGIKTIHVKL